MTDHLFNSDHDPDNDSDTPEQHPLLEPMFWGTGDMLVWDTQQLLSSIDRNELFKTYWAKEILSDEELNDDIRAVYNRELEALTTRIIGDNLIDGRGFYGYFPVITDNEEVLVLDPSDFHSSLFSMTFSSVGGLFGYPLAHAFRAEGDVIAFGAVTIGNAMTFLLREYANGEDAEKKSHYCNALCQYLVEALSRRLTVELRRGFGLEDTEGNVFPFELSNSEHIAVLPSLIETTAIEERLGVFLTDDKKMVPEFSRLLYFVHHPEV